MAVLLNKSYGAFPAGSVAVLPASTEAAIVSQGIGSASAAVPTAGAGSSNEFAGRATFTTGTASVVITNPLVTANSKIWAVVNAAAADGTLLRIERIVPAAGSFTVYGTANSTGVVSFDWAIISCGEAPIV